MASTKVQVYALLKKEYRLMVRSSNWLIQELFSPLVAVYLIYHSTQRNEMGVTLGPLAISLFQSRTMFGLMYGVVFEKSQNYKEYLRVNGASLFSYIFSTFLFYMIRSFIAATILYVGVLYVGAGSGNFLDNVFGYISLLVYSVALINFSLALTTLFSSPKLATQISSFILLLLNCAYYAVVKSDKIIYYYLGSLLPPVAGVFGISMASTNQANPAGFTHFEAVLVQFFNCFLYFGLYVYLDKVVPSDSGIKDPIWKCFNQKQHSALKENELPTLDAEQTLNSRLLLNQGNHGINQTRPLQSDVDDVSSAMHHEPFHNPNSLKRTVFIENLTKKFGQNVAVDGATLSIFEKQIFCLLGHNGAGKTTAINMMTGLLRPDGGGIFYDDEDFAGNFEQIRKKFGLCVQKDILYENLTAYEHLEMISLLRGVSADNISNYITFLSQKVGIENELTKKSNTLSGGNKRKLSLAMAIAGDTKVIFLDEPTSGLDPNARRSFWDLVRLLRDEGKTILLTTHNLDEADELADRIAIMSKGKLLIMGTSNYLKKKYGVGYNLILTPKPNAIQEFLINKSRLIDLVRNSILNSELDTKTAPEMVKITLPYGESHKFPDVFHILEKETSIEVALELNTLEDVFVNIGLQNEALENQNSPSDSYHENIPIPPSINQGIIESIFSQLIPSTEPAFNFMQQVKAMFKRRVYCTFRSRNNLFQVVFPLLYVIFSNVMTASNQEPMQQIAVFTMFSLMGFMLNTVFYTSFPVWEREQNIKYLLRTMGLQPLPYWLGTFLFDILLISTYGLFLIPTGYFLGINIMAKTAWNFTMIILCFGFTLLTQSYLLSWIYSKQATVYKFHMVLILLGFLYVPLILFFVLVFTTKGGSQESPLHVFLFGAVVSPPVVFMFSCFSLAGFPLILNLEDNYFKSLFKYPAFYAAILILQGLLYFFINYLLELRSLRLSSKVPKTIQSTIFSDHIPNPQEIHQEDQRVRGEHNQDLTKTIDLEKIYDNGYQGLRGVTFGVEKKQIFGLLGPNGAGKSTTFNILTGLIPKTSGRVIFNGHELQTLHSDIFQNTGICPQFDALWDQLSVAEHLKIVGDIKGLTRLTINDSISYYAKILRMEEHLNKKAEQLSGGTKRKLCVANLLIGAPVVQFMDEPSTGLDPLSKRALYDTIVKNLDDRNASIILTTHSMAEAESLCNKIGILINGKFVCLGTLPYLKSRYGTGYKILVVRANSHPEIYEKRILEAFPSAVKEKDNSEVYDSYRVTTQDFSFERAFKVMEGLKLAKQVSDFNILNTTLEHVFIQFSRNQIEPEVRPSTTS